MEMLRRKRGRRPLRTTGSSSSNKLFMSSFWLKSLSAINWLSAASRTATGCRPSRMRVTTERLSSRTPK